MSSRSARPRRRLGWIAGAVGGALVIVVVCVLVASLLGGNALVGGEPTGGPAKPEKSKPENFLRVYEPEPPTRIRGRTLAESDGLFAGPHFVLRITRVHVTDSVDVGLAHSLGEDEAFSAAAGQELLLFVAGDEPDIEPAWGEKDVDASLVVDGKERPLTRMPAFGDVVVVSVPKGAPVLLQVTDTERRFRFDLRAGRVDRDASYTASSEELPSALYQASAEVVYRNRRQKLRVELLHKIGEVARVRKDPYHPDVGWARPGRAWLTVGPFAGNSLPSEYHRKSGMFDVAFDLDVRRSLRLKMPGGGALSPVRTWPRHEPIHQRMKSPDREIVALFDVPASFREGQLVITPRGAIAVDSQSPISAEDVRPHQDCGESGIVCLAWSEAPPTRTIPIEVS